MKPYIEICGRPLATYTIMAALGVLVSVPLFVTLLRNKNVLRIYSRGLVFSAFGMIIGAKLFGIISFGLDCIINHRRVSLGMLCTKTGIVYYGGLFGVLVSYYLFCKYSKHPFTAITSELAVCIPLFHFFGRVGCFFTGCCYGMEWNGFFSLLYNNGKDIVRRVPTQLTEAVFELIMFASMYTLYKKGDQSVRKALLNSYLFCYALFRFIIEYYRGDDIRGIYGVFSFSQYVSIVIIVSTIIMGRNKVVKICKRKFCVRNSDT